MPNHPSANRQHSFPRRAAEVEPPRPSEQLTEDEAAAERERVRRSVDYSARVRAAALAVGCQEHDAGPGESCYQFSNGMCRPRYDRGVVEEGLHPRLEPGELEPLAAATRYAQRDRRIRNAAARRGAR